jgi:D-hexose-6-phosphate mutarotase
VNELNDRLQMELNYEKANYSDKDYYFTLVFPSYIQEGHITKVDVQKLTAKSSLIGGTIVSVSKNGPEMTNETIEAIVNGELPFVKQILIGEKISMNH